MSLWERAMRMFAVLVVAAGMAACGGSSTPAPPQLQASPESIVLTAIGQTQTITSSNASGVTGTSSNGSVASVATGSTSSAVVVKAVGAGTAQITLSASGFMSGSASVTVTVTNLAPR
jgi:hypothetical protein